MNSESSINEGSTDRERITALEADNAELRRQLDRCTIHADSLVAQINRLSVIDEPAIRGPLEVTCNLPREHC